MSQPIKVKNFLFHRVNPIRDELWDPMDVRKFEQCIRYLSKKHEILNLEEACNKTFRSSSGKPLATITFDDGYHDNLEYAAPILQKYHCPASFYIVTDCIDSGRMVWTQEIKHCFQSTHLLHFNADLSYLPQKLQIKKWKNRQQRLAYAQDIRNFLLQASQELRDRFLGDICTAFPDVKRPDLMMVWEDVQQLHTAGYIIGSHTKTHPVLTTLEHTDIESELRLSGNRIQEMLGMFPKTVAYPFGAYDSKVTSAAYRTGYRYGITSNQQWYYSDKDSAYSISRTMLTNEPWLKTLSRINGSFERMKGLIRGRQDRWDPLSFAGNVLASAGYDALNVLP